MLVKTSLRVWRSAIFVSCLVYAAASPAESNNLFSVDFENGLNAVGAVPAHPRSVSAGGYEVPTEANKGLSGVTINQQFAAQGKSCLQLGHNVVWHIGQQDISTGRLSFWVMPVTLPAKEEPAEFVWGGDAAKPHQTFSLKILHDGTVSANYFSWQNDQKWLSGVRGTNSINAREWNHIAFTWGAGGQRIYINGCLSASNEERFPISWLQDIRFGGLPVYLDDIDLSTSDEVKVQPSLVGRWEPTTAIQKDLAEVEKGAQRLVKSAPQGSDAYARGLVIAYSSQVAWTTALQDPPSDLALDNVKWMKAALGETEAKWRKGEIPVPLFDASKRIGLCDGRILQDGRPTFLIGNYSPTPIDNQIGFNLCNALMPGPAYALSTPQQVGDRGSALVGSIDKAQADNKVIDVLLSLDVPPWIDQLDPHVRESGAGWFSYNVESPAVPAMFRAAADIVIPTIKGHGTNVIINLANEPAYSGYSLHTTAPRWRAWLMARHGSIANLNEAWGTKFGSFLDITGPANIKAEYVACQDPGGLEVPTDPKVLGQWHDWCVFNQQRYAAFLSHIRDNMKQQRPDLLFHAKWLQNFSGWWKSIGYALNPYNITKVSDFAGTDAWTIYAGRDPECYWGIWWEDFTRAYDLLKSIAPGKPVLNSENHILRGDDPSAPPLKYGTYHDVLPWQFFYTALWEQMIHGGGGGEMWTYWESGKGYNLTERAKALDALSKAARDLRRYANEVTGLANERPRIALLLSTAALAWAPKEHTEASVQAYKAMNQLGLPVGYMLEEMIPDGGLDRYEVLVVPSAQHIARAMNQAIENFVARGGLVIVTGATPQADEYGKPLNFTASAMVWSDMKPVSGDGAKAFDAAHPQSLSTDDSVARELQVRLDGALRKKGVAPLVDLKNGEELPYGLEWRSIRQGGKLVVNVCNFSNRPQVVTLTVGGKTFRGVNLLNGQVVKGSLNLAPLEVVLLQSK